MSPYFKKADMSVEGEINYGAQLTCQGRSKEIRLGGREVGKPDRDIWVMFQTHQPLSSGNGLSHGARHEYKMAGKMCLHQISDFPDRTDRHNRNTTTDRLDWDTESQ